LIKNKTKTIDKHIFLAVEYPRYIAIFPYEAQQDDELSFPADAIFEILEDAGNSGWYKARYNQQIGLIPSTYVKPIDEQTPCKLK
jgi:myosin-1